MVIGYFLSIKQDLTFLRQCWDFCQMLKSWTLPSIAKDFRAAMLSILNIAIHFTVPLSCEWLKKNWRIRDYNPKFLHCPRVNLSLKPKFFNQPFFSNWYNPIILICRNGIVNSAQVTKVTSLIILPQNLALAL